MKFHTTLKDIVVAILVLLSCTVVVWWGVANLGMTNPSQSFAAYLLERIDGDGDMKITVGSVARNWLRTFTICDVSVTIEGDEIAHFDELRVSGGARRIALALLKRGTQLDIEVDGLTISLDEGALALFSADSSAPSRPLERLRLYIQAADADIALALPSLEAHLSGGGFTAMIDGGVANLTVAGSADVLSVSQNDGQGRVEQLRYGIDETGRLALEAEKADWSSPSLFLQTSNLVMAAQQQGGLSLSADELRLEMGDLAVASPQVVVHAAIEEGEVAEFTVSLSALDVASQSWSFAAPALASSGSRSESGTHTLAVASRSDEDFHFQSELLGTFNANTLGGRFIYEVPSTIRGELTFATLAWDEQLTAHNVIVSLSDVDAKRVDIAGSVTARLQMVLTEGLGTIETDLVANITLHRESAALTATVDFIDAQSSLLASPVDVHLSLQGRGEEAQVEAKVVIPDQAELSALYNQGDGERTVMMSGRLTDLRAGTFRQLMDAYTPFLKPYIHDDTRLSGNIAFSGSDGSGGREGRLSTELALLEAHVGNFDLDAGFTFTGTLDGDRLTVSPMTLATSGYRLAFSGETEVGHWLPRGELSLSRTDDGQLLAHATMVDRPPSSYEFSLVTAIEPIITVDGLVGKQTTNSLTGQGLLTMLDDAVPFTFDLATDTLELSVVQEERLLLHASLAPPQRLVMQADRFLVPGTSTSFSGTLEARYANLFDWSARSSDFALDSVTIKGRRYSLTAPFSASSAEILIPTFTIGVEGTRSTGSFFYRGFDLARLKASGFVAPYEVALQIDDLLSLSLIGDERRLEMAASIKNLPLGRLMNTADDASLSLSLVGATDFTTLLSSDGSLSYQNDTSSFSTRFTADERHLALFDAAFRAGEFTVSGEEVRFDSGAISAALIAEHVRHLSYIDQRSHLKVTAALQLPQTETLFDLVKKGGLLLGEELAATLSITDVLLLGEGGIADGLYHLRWKDGALSGESELLTFSYDTKSGHFTLSADPEFGIGINAYGSLSAKDFGVVATNIRLPLVMLNRTFLKPIFLFKSGYGEGEITLGGTKDAIRPYGQLFVNATEMFVFWLPDDQINMKGVSVTIDGNRATTGRVPFFSTNAKTGQTVHGFGNLSAHFDGLSLLNYEIHADDVDHPVFLWIPMSGQDVDIQGYAQGTFNLFGIGFETWLDGDVTISDMSMTMGIKGLPSWYEPGYVTSTSFNVKTGKGVKFFYPNNPNPIISATLTENQSFSFTYDHLTDEFEVDGNFAFRSGEIYYFQKNFFITEGSMVLHTDAISGSSAVIPRINLRAKVTDFDSVGNRVDIFLVLRDSTLTSLNPYFESIPTKEVNEIMEILGQSILPTGAYGEIGLYSVASLAAAATDVAERLGLLELSQTAQLTETIRISLGLDMFSIRSNIVQNILFDALPVTGVMGTLSPIARYLHNTSIFMGKYIGTNFFLQALVHLSAMERSKVGSSFLSPDLSIDLELSLDWENPLATISFFTQPSELSFTNILDTMGFSVTKRIVLR